MSDGIDRDPMETAPATDAARQWSGWGTALKPSHEPIIVARKPLQGTVAENVLKHGTGGINVDGCRVGTEDNLNGGRYSDNKKGDDGNSYGSGINERSARDFEQPSGRWPANLIHDGSDEVIDLLGDAARFFYVPKASRKDRNEGCEGMEQKMPTAPNGAENAVIANRGSRSGPRENHHPTVKPTDLMRYLCRLVTPPGGLVLDPFGGSGSTGKAALLEGFRVTLCELSEEYWPIIEARCQWAANERPEGEVLAKRQRTLFSGD